MPHLLKWLSWSLVAAGLVGCAEPAPPPVVPVPAGPTANAPAEPAIKPLPAPTRDDVPPPPYTDVPIVSQQTDEAPQFLAAYNRVNRPRICVFVNRSLQGDLMAVNPNQPLVTVEHKQSSNTGVNVDRNVTATHEGIYHQDQVNGQSKFESKGPAQYQEETSIYLPPGQYDEAQAKSIDYEAIESILTDVISCDNQVTIISPTVVRQKLSDQQVKDLENGKPQVASDVVQQLGTDILVQVAVHPTRQTSEGLAVRLVGEAVNIRGGQSLGRVVLDIPAPLEKTTINKFARFAGRKLIRDMTYAWDAPPPTPASASPATPMERPAAPTTQPEK